MGNSRRILRLVFKRVNYKLDCIITNMISCRPLTYDRWGNLSANRPPSPQEIERCSPKLQEILSFTEYQAVIFLGNVASGLKIKNSYKMLHPAAIAREEYPTYFIKEQAALLNEFLNAQSSRM